MEVADTRPRGWLRREFQRFTEGAALLVAARRRRAIPDQSGLRRPAKTNADAATDGADAAASDLRGVVWASPRCFGVSGSRWCRRFLSAPTVLPALSGHGPQRSR